LSCSEKLEDEPNEAVRLMVRTANEELVTLSESVRDLKKELFSASTDVEPSESVRDLKSEFSSVSVETRPMELLRFTVRPMKNELPRVIVSVRTLNSEDCSMKPEAEPTEADRLTVRPRKRELARLMESVKDRKIEFFSAVLDAMPIDAARLTVRPFKNAIPLFSLRAVAGRSICLLNRQRLDQVRKALGDRGYITGQTIAAQTKNLKGD